MSMTTEKVLVGILGLTLFVSVVLVGFVDTKHRRQAKRESVPAAAAMNPQLSGGRGVFEKFSCTSCHGVDGKGGVTNFNAKTAQQISALTFVAESYTKQELKDKILNGVKQVDKLDPNGPTPPLYMPSFRGLISDDEIELLIGYLDSLLPKKDKDSW